MKLKYGIVSTITMGLAMGVGVIGLGMESISYALLYIVLIGIGSYIVLKNYCRKCPHSMNNSCHRIIPGRLAKKLPYIKTGKYTILEIISVVMVILSVLITPLMSLYKVMPLLITYGILWIFTIALTRSKVCKTCMNRWCTLCPNRVKM